MKEKIIECVPNFSEGNDLAVLECIRKAILKGNSKVLHIDRGPSANRTVFTFAGSPANIMQSAYEAIAVAANRIDMSKQTGEHPRIGSTDVCPLIPITGLEMNEVIDLSYTLAHKIGSKLGYPVFCYEHSAKQENRKKLEIIRKGEYEGLRKRFEQNNEQADFGPSEFRPNQGATVIGARDILIAYNINLKSSNLEIAKRVAGLLRESGYLKQGVRMSGKFKGVKAIGWKIENLNKVQISTNITDYNSTPLHEIFEFSKTQLLDKGEHLSGSELIGLLPKKALTDAGEYYSKSRESNEKELIACAIKHLGLGDLKPFNSSERIIEDMLKSDKEATII